jgi:hypothetical protein
MSAHLTEPVPDPGDRVQSLSPETRTLVMTALAKDADKRYRSFALFAQACAEALEKVADRALASPKFLRKPLVIKQPARRGETSLAAVVNPGQASTKVAKIASTVMAPVGGPSTRPGEGISRPPTGSLKPATAGQGSSRGPVSRAPDHRPASSRLQPLGAGSSHQGNVPTSSNELVPGSAAFLDPHPSPGIGMLPWVVLGFAVLALVVFLVMSYL